MSKIDIQELIRIARENKEAIYNKDVSKDLDDATKFVIAFKIKEGKNKILAATIYKSYTLWAIKPMGKTPFFHSFAKLFQAEKSQYTNFYMLNYKPAQLVNEAEKRKITFEK